MASTSVRTVPSARAGSTSAAIVIEPVAPGATDAIGQLNVTFLAVSEGVRARS